MALLAVAACTVNAPSAPEPATAAGRVLVISPRHAQGVERLVALLAAGGQGSPPLPPVAAEVVWAEETAEVTALLRQRQPDLQRYRAIYSTSMVFARAAQLVTREVPIVFEGVDDPVPLCLVDSLHRPGRNATGYMHYLHDDEFKMLQLLRDGFPALRDVLMLVAGDNLPPSDCNPDNDYWTTPATGDCMPGERLLDDYLQRRVRGRELQAYAASQGMALRFVVVCSAADFDALPAFGSRHPERAGWLVPWHSLFDRNRETLTRKLNESRLPAIYPHPGYTRGGGLMSLSALLDEGPDRASVLTLLQVLGGAPPATLPVLSPRGFSLTVNARTAEQLSTRPSLLLLRRADRILQ